MGLLILGKDPISPRGGRALFFGETLDMLSARLIERGNNVMETRSASDIEESTEKLLQDLKEVVRDGEELLRAGADELGERGAAAREKLAAALEMAKETQRRLQERAVAGAKAADSYIRDNPYQSIGVAFGVGLLLGLYVSRR
jgi:ElaB/YqjD/DUF883 family membrane-anchored ribosome-binding protein